MNAVPLLSIKARFAAIALCWLPVTALCQTASHSVVTGPETGTHIHIGEDLSRLVAQPAGISLRALASKGSVENIQRLRYEPGVRLALAQSDVYRAYTNLMNSGNAAAGKLIQPLRVVVPLFDEEVHVVVRADSTLANLRDIRGKRINIGPLGSGTAMTATTLYQIMFGEPIPDHLVSTDTNEVALGKLANDSGPEVVFVVSGQPVGLFTNIKPSVEQYFKLLRFDGSNPIEQPALYVYQSARIERKSYPNWLAEDLPALSTKTLLVTYDYNTSDTRQMLVRLAQSLCHQFPTLQLEGHPKWKQVRLDQPPLGRGWQYYAPTKTALDQCIAQRGAAPVPATCSRDEAALGFCSRRP
jgi:uncharacterized protein